MSLTEKGLSERTWGWLPNLRKAIEDKIIPSKYYGITSAHDNMFDNMYRLMEIVTRVEEYEQEIKETAISAGRKEMCHDLERLMKELTHAKNYFENASYKVRKIYDRLWTLKGD